MDRRPRLGESVSGARRMGGEGPLRKTALLAAWLVLVLLALLGGGVGAQNSEAQPPQAFRTLPDNVTVREGDDAELRCGVLGVQGDVQWAKDGLLLGSDPRIPGFPRYSMTGDPRRGDFNLRILSCELSDDATFQCQVARSESSPGLVSPSVLLTVLIPPKDVQLSPEAGTMVTWVAGQKYPVTCVSGGAKPAAEISFLLSGRLLPDVSVAVDPELQQKLFRSTAEIRVTPSAVDDGKQLECQAQHPSLGTPVAAAFTLNVLFPPEPPTIEWTGELRGKAGETLELPCVARGGNPLAALQWFKDEQVVSTAWETDHVHALARSVLSLKLQAKDNGARLSCEAQNSVSPSPQTSSLTLRVLFPPEQIRIQSVSSDTFSLEENKTKTLLCISEASNPPARLTWWLGSQELRASFSNLTEGQHGGQVSRSEVSYTARREDSGLKLTCEAFNEDFKEEISKEHRHAPPDRSREKPKWHKSVTLSVIYPIQKLWIDGPSPGRTFRAGNRVKLVCLASGGNPEPRLFWLKNTVDIKDTNPQVNLRNTVSRELLLTLAPSDNKLNYTCRASSRRPQLQVTTWFHVQFPPVNVTIRPDKPVLRRGDNVTLTCLSRSSNPPVNLSWDKEGESLQGKDLKREKGSFGGFSATEKLRLLVSSRDNGNRVTCRAHSAELRETVSAFHKLNVLYPPEFTGEQVQVVEARENGGAVLSVTVTANPPPRAYNWSFRGFELNSDGGPRHRVRPGGALELWNLTRTDSGQYQLLCQNPEGVNRTLIRLDVHYAPTIRSIRDPIEVDVGGSVDIVCIADANPVLPGMFRWAWLGEEERSLEELERTAEGTKGRLHIRGATLAQAGGYQCVVDNGVPPPAQALTRLIVRFAPRVESTVPSAKVAVAGDRSGSATLHCRAHGVPDVTFSWAKGGVSLDLQDPRYTEHTYHQGTVHSSLLTIANVSAAHDYALFTCTATNALGTDHTHIQIVSISRPDPPTGLKVVSVSHHSVGLEWQAGFNGGLDQRFRVRYEALDTPGFLYVDVHPQQATAFTLTGLRPSTRYRFSILALNALGESDYADSGAQLPITTQDVEQTAGEDNAEFPTELPEDSSPVPLLPLLLGLGALLLASNASILGCALWKRKQRPLEGAVKDKEEGSEPPVGNEYEENQGRARRDSGSYSGSDSLSTAGSSAESWPHRPRPRRDLALRLLPALEEEPPRRGQRLHEYEEVGGPGPLYAEVEGAYLPYEDPYVGANQPGGWPTSNYEEPLRVYDPVAEDPPLGGQEYLPFELRGELV
ncbi:nephrin isoform X3 [Tachyglossus aculeatus]|uniref:nephrin isoform X3 n=1 Tax=Tachyglossus aculeatus TaxID=9261 RepID=UPI0018F7A656|nr:nephrin isoform X3 [Tachyglossus aculeatus]